MPLPSERLVGWLAPKWIVAAVALAAVVMLASYDPRLGFAAGALFGGVIAVWLYLALRYGSLSGARSVRSSIVETAAVHSRNRRKAEARTGLGAQQRPDPTQRP
ncbi:hypothetical protein ACLBKU_03750 [Erythrobacter sp. NE805]|uniref:hypothetical protein n=1 Tax=Erythrobacter sp. NE805 TaxID=3389875 RepID=UPI00396B36B3